MTEFQPDQPEDLIRSLVRRIGILERQGGTGTAISASTFTGKVEITAGSVAPTGWLLCDGSAVSRTTYASLFAAIGTTYGSGDGSTTFNVPNAKGRVIVGRDAAQTEFDTLGETGGAKTVTLTIAQMPEHDHQQTFSTHAIASGGGSTLGGMTSSGGNQLGDAQQWTHFEGGDQPHPNLQPYIVMNYVIKT